MLLLFSQIMIAQKQITWEVETWPVQTVDVFVPSEPIYSEWYPDITPTNVNEPINEISNWYSINTWRDNTAQWQRVRRIGNSFLQYQTVTVFYDPIKVDLDVYDKIIESINRESSKYRSPR